MSDFAYHMEALRKARIIERKNASQYSSGARQHQMDHYNPDMGSASQQKCMTYGDSHRTVEVRQGTGYDMITLPPSARQSSACVQSGIYKDLKRQEKTLRNHNLVMGPMTAFKDYFDTNSYSPRKSAMTHYQTGAINY